MERKRFHLAQDISLYTIGYEGRDLEEFTSCLKSFGIQTLIDVRDIPYSRKKGFSKSPLSQYLEEFGIEYIHLKQLGSPKDLREKVKTDGDYKSFYKAYSSHIQSQKESVETLYQIVMSNNACIMCYERDPNNCHRLMVADVIKKKGHNGFVVQHI